MLFSGDLVSRENKRIIRPWSTNHDYEEVSCGHKVLSVLMLLPKRRVQLKVTSLEHYNVLQPSSFLFKTSSKEMKRSGCQQTSRTGKSAILFSLDHPSNVINTLALWPYSISWLSLFPQSITSSTSTHLTPLSSRKRHVSLLNSNLQCPLSIYLRL